MAAGCSSHPHEANAQGCGRCRTMEEDFYWRHIKSLRFWVLLSRNFHQKLLIPKKFADNVKLTVVRPKMTLRGPSGASWDVTLATGADGLFIEDGWEDFVKAYSLEENNLLFFKYDRHSSFDIKIFDGECEKAAAYFVKNCDNVVQKRASSEISHENDDDGVCTITKKARVDVVTEPTPERPQLYKFRCRIPKQTPTRQKPVQPAVGLPRKKAPLKSLKEPQGLYSYVSAAPEPEKQPVASGTCPPGAPPEKAALPETNVRQRRSCSSRKTASVGQNLAVVTENCLPGATFEKVVPRKMGGKPRKLPACSNKQTATADQCLLEAGESGSSDAANKKAALCKRRGGPRKPPCSKKKASTGECYVSNRRPVTEQEKDRTLRMACDMLTERSFFVAMQPSFCYKSFFLKLPSKWAAAYLGPKNFSVVLRVGEKTWPTRFNFRECALESGWKQFALENHLEESDICLFELTCKDRDSVMLDVTIIRVVDEVTPPTLLTA